MIRHATDLVELAEGILIVAILFAVAWAAWTALSDAYSPIFRLLHSV